MKALVRRQTLWLLAIWMILSLSAGGTGKSVSAQFVQPIWGVYELTATPVAQDISIAPPAADNIGIEWVSITTEADCTLRLVEESSGTLIYSGRMGARTPFYGIDLATTVVGKKLQVTSTVTTPVSINIKYHWE